MNSSCSNERQDVVPEQIVHPGRPAARTSPRGTSNGASRAYPEWAPLLRSCNRRVRRWRVPPNWSRQDWFEEAEALALAALCQAIQEFDPSRGVPQEAFFLQRVIARVYSRYRREWAFARRHGLPGVEFDRAGDSASQQFGSKLRSDRLHEALALLSVEDRQLLIRIYWEGLTQDEVARLDDVSQQTISKRLRRLLGHFVDVMDFVEDRLTVRDERG
jgi:RNA polymerase sigma factor (sigma-70 family)